MRKYEIMKNLNKYNFSDEIITGEILKEKNPDEFYKKLVKSAKNYIELQSQLAFHVYKSNKEFYEAARQSANRNFNALFNFCCSWYNAE